MAQNRTEEILMGYENFTDLVAGGMKQHANILLGYEKNFATFLGPGILKKGYSFQKKSDVQGKELLLSIGLLLRYWL